MNVILAAAWRKRVVTQSLCLALITLSTTTTPAAPPTAVPEHRAKLYAQWKRLAEPPVTPYHGPFGPSARAFVGKVDWKHPDPKIVQNWKAMNDYPHTAENGVYDPKLDPRPINQTYETATLEDWKRMGYNCSYKGNYFTFLVGGYLKEKGMLGAIDQTLWGANGPPPLQFDGAEGKRQREACGSFFAPENYQAGVAAITGMGHYYGRHLFTVGDHRLTCSWDEVGLRTRAQMDYRGDMKEEFRKFLKDVWFGDASPAQDTNRDGRTYNGFTGQKLKHWEEVEPINVSLDWARPAWKDGTQQFSAMPQVDTVIYREPARYKLLVDFHRYFTFEFFRRVNEDATPRNEPAGDARAGELLPLHAALHHLAGGQPAARQQLLLVPSPQPGGECRALLARLPRDESELRDHRSPGPAP